jgi:Flp pilus assembly pilin Flp
MRARRICGQWRAGFASFRRDRSGSTGIEYALIAAIVAIFAIGSLVAFSAETGALYGTLAEIAATIAASLARG